MIEHKGDRLLPFALFVWRMLLSVGAAVLLVAFALSAGAYGYRTTEHMGWLDAYLEVACAHSRNPT